MLCLQIRSCFSIATSPGCSSTAACSKRRSTRTNPLLERVKFLAITASNLDEFVEVRVAGLLQQAEQGQGEAGPDGLAPARSARRSFPRRFTNS